MLILKLVELKANRPYAALSATFQASNCFVNIQLEDNHFERKEDNIILNFQGLQFLCQTVMDGISEKPQQEF